MKKEKKNRKYTENGTRGPTHLRPPSSVGQLVEGGESKRGRGEKVSIIHSLTLNLLS